MIARAEQRPVRNFREGVLPGNVHLHIGEAAAAKALLAPRDQAGAEIAR